MGSEGFSQAGLNTSRIMKRKLVRPYTEVRTRNIHAVWPVADASDRLDVDVDEPFDPDGLGGEVTDTVGTARVLASPRTPTKAEREERMMCLTCLIAFGVDSVSCEGDWRDAT